MAQQSNRDTNSWKSLIFSTALIGLIVLIPIAILFLAAMEIHGLLDDAASFAKLALPFPAIVNGAIFVVLGVLEFFDFCFVILDNGSSPPSPE